MNTLDFPSISSKSSLRHVFKFAWADGYEYVEGVDGDEVLFKDQLNIKSFPSIILYPFGPKQLKASIVLGKNEIRDINIAIYVSEDIGLKYWF